LHGYWNNPEATREALPGDGWLHTGDLAEIDLDGHIRITERKKDIIVLAGGTNVAPQRVEAALLGAPEVAQALAVGDGRPFIGALIVADSEQTHGLTESETRAVLERAVAQANERLGREEQVRRFAVLPRELSEAAGEVTPTLKLRRRVVEAHLRDEIERLYAGGR
jgi:long-chain acyl-CoA synthetase